MALRSAQWRGRRVLVTGHTGFKGAWLALWLRELGARVTGFSLPAPTDPSLFEMARVGDGMRHLVGDVRDVAALRAAFDVAEPELVLHLAAQSLVREAYRDPVATYQTNVLGTVNVLEQCRFRPSIRGVLVVTSDKCYQHRGPQSAFQEGDPLGGADPYSSSKACAELVTAAYRNSFFATDDAPLVATARAGNVIGGGDFAPERLLPDVVRAVEAQRPVAVRNPSAVRPWQHVLECLRGYLMLGELLCSGDRICAQAWNFGPAQWDAKPVAWMVQQALAQFDRPQDWAARPEHAFPEAARLTLDSTKACASLGWKPLLDVATALEWTVGWHRACSAGVDPQAVTLEQIDRYSALCGAP